MRLLTIPEVAVRLHCSVSQVKNIIARERLPVVVGLAKGRLVAEEDLDQWLAARPRLVVAERPRLRAVR